MQAYIDNTARELGIDKVCLMAARKVDHIANELTSFYERIDSLINSPSEHHHKKSLEFAHSFTQLFSLMGYPDTTPAGVKISNRAKKDAGLKRISPVIDAYNSASALYSYGIGAHDAQKINTKDIIVRRAADGDSIKPMFSEKSKNIPAGDLLYTHGNEVVAWLGRKDVDSDDCKITAQTGEVIFVLLGRKDISDASLEEVAHVIESNLAICCQQLQTEISLFK